MTCCSVVGYRWIHMHLGADAVTRVLLQDAVITCCTNCRFNGMADIGEAVPRHSH